MSSGVPDSGRSKISALSLQRTQLEAPNIFLPIDPIHFGPPKDDYLLTKDKMTVPKCPLLGDSTVFVGKNDTMYSDTYKHTCEQILS